jgi:hypothetical protein
MRVFRSMGRNNYQSLSSEFQQFTWVIYSLLLCRLNMLGEYAEFPYICNQQDKALLSELSIFTDHIIIITATALANAITSRNISWIFDDPLTGRLLII